MGSNPTQGKFSFKHLFSLSIYIYIYIHCIYIYIYIFFFFFFSGPAVLPDNIKSHFVC